VLLPAQSLAEATPPEPEFRHLQGEALHGHILGRDITDNAHTDDAYRAERYRRDGVLQIITMGQRTTGRRKIECDQSCIPPSPQTDFEHLSFEGTRGVEPTPAAQCLKEEKNAMRRPAFRLHPTVAVLALVTGLHAAPGMAQTADADWHRTVASTLGKPGAEMPGGVYRVAMPRTDLHVTLDGVAIRPGFALGSWLAFQQHGSELMVMGDLVLLETEVGPVMRRMAAEGIEITALHNHVLRAQPTTLYMHVAGHGAPDHLATALRAGLRESATPLVGAAGPAPGEQIADLDTAAFARGLGREGRASGGVYAVTVPRAEVIHEHGAEVAPAFGLGTAINLQAAGNGRGAITGDLVLTAAEVVPVQRALLENGIEMTALHTHMVDEEPRLFFMHFWAVGEPERLGQGLRAAIACTNSKPAE
jgi:Domain of Unknown Function (DUF1259)